MENDKITSRFNQAAEDYDKQRKLFIPCYDDYYGIVQTLLKFKKPKIETVLDLGAGTGLLTMYVKQIFPDADYTLVDLSDKMLDVARKRFGNCKNMKYEVLDYSSSFPHGEFDLIVSALSIHHLDDSKKQLLYKNIYNKLTKNGYLINLDQFNADSEDVNKFYSDCWYDSIKNSGISEAEKNLWLKRRELDKENSISQSIGMIKDSGFSNVECIYQYMKFGVLLAYKKEESAL